MNKISITTILDVWNKNLSAYTCTYSTVSFLASHVSFLARQFLFPARRVSFLVRRFSFLSRIAEAFSMEYITRKKPVPTCKGRYQSDGTDRRDDKKDTPRQLLASLKIISPNISVSIWQNWMIQTLK